MQLQHEPRVAIAAELGAGLFTGLDPAAQIRPLAGETMGTYWSLALAGGGGEARDVVETCFAQVISESSLWKPTSEISRFNGAPAGSWHTLSEGFHAVVEAALGMAEASGGAFDPALGALTDLWGFGPAGQRPLPGAEAIRQIQAGRWKDLQLKDGALLQPGGVQLDLNGIAKGQAVDRVATQLLASGHSHFLIGIGGEYRGEGVRPDGQPWWVDVEQPPGAGLPPLRLALSGLCVATSGDYRRARFSAGTRLSHSLDPTTGAPIANEVASVAVIGQCCMLADAEATAITVLGPEAGMRWAAERGLAVQMLLRGPGGFEERLSPALGAMLE